MVEIIYQTNKIYHLQNNKIYHIQWDIMRSYLENI